MSSEDNNDREWRRRRMPSFFRDWGFGDMDKFFEDMEKLMEEEFKDFTSRVPKDYVRERRRPDGSIEREWGPFVYGYSMRIGPNGKPEIREFGNVKPSLRGPKVQEEREPLVDVVETENDVHVVVELPGVDKNDIKLHGNEDSVTISVDTPQRKYFKEIPLTTKVRVKDAKSEYKNGVLEIVLPKIDDKFSKGQPISIL